MMRHNLLRVSFLPFILLIMTLVACTSGTGEKEAPPSSPADPMELTGELVRTDGYRIPANPVTGDETAEAFQEGLFYRYRLHKGSPVGAIMILMPGGSTGANNFDYMAREMIRMSNGGVEVWVLERRPNLMEDLTGMEAAEATGDPQVAIDYYYKGKELNGGTFQGLLAQEEVPFLSEWGLACLMHDVQAVVDLVPEEKRQTNLIIGGHSLGVAHVLYYLGWDFDGMESTLTDGGYNQTAASFLLDAPIVASAPSLSKNRYLADLDKIRDGRSSRYEGFFQEITPGLLAFAEVLGMAAHPRFDDPADPHDGPEGIARFNDLVLGADVEYFLDLTFSESLLDAWFHLPPSRHDFVVTNEALLGILFDDNFQVITPFHLSMGFVFPHHKTKPRAFPAVPLFVTPGYALTEPGMLYAWHDYNEVEGIPQTRPGEEVTEVSRLAEAMWRGPTNYGEWYFASRLGVDASAVGMLGNLREDDWQAVDFGLNLFHTSKVDVPILCIGAGGGMVPDPALVAPIADSVAETTRDGTPRSSEDAFKVRIAEGHGHFDVLLADNAVQGGNGVFGEILDFVFQHTEGTVTVP